MPSIYNSQSQAYKTPFGAVPAGQRVRFALCVPPEYHCETPYLFLKPDGGAPSRFALEKQPGAQGGDWFAVEIAAGEPGLYFYYFDLWTGYRKLFRGPAGEAAETTGEGEWYQLTVYAPTFATPAPAHGGVMYQIFPDRFFEGDPHKPLYFNERVYRPDKTKEPYFWPTEQESGYLTRDFFGGDLLGIQKRLPFLASLGVTWVYLNPIFEAHSNHRYNTADYLKVDPYLGTEEDFTALCEAARGFGIRIILDGVFSHTGSDSVYFNKEGRYPTVGAWQGPQSPYRHWYKFHPDGSYDSWWGFLTLPVCDKHDPDFRRFICGEGGVVDTWLRRGASGFRLDVADELPDDFIAEIRAAVKRRGEDNLLIGEVWEDASNKVAYDVRRRYFLGDELDGVMNYPFRTAILDFLKTGDAAAFQDRVLSIVENYPAPAMAACTTHLSTHDTVRAITELAGEPVDDHGRDWQSGRRLTGLQYQLGIQRMRLAFVLQFTLPGIPCVYYGDEIAMQGYKDPFNRAYYDWHSAETHLLGLTRELALLRRDCAAFQDGTLQVTYADGGVVAYQRQGGGAEAAVAVNASNGSADVLLLGETVRVPPMQFAVRTSGDLAPAMVAGGDVQVGRLKSVKRNL